MENLDLHLIFIVIQLILFVLFTWRGLTHYVKNEKNDAVQFLTASAVVLALVLIVGFVGISHAVEMAMIKYLNK